jgi:hypothetical protein
MNGRNLSLSKCLMMAVLALAVRFAPASDVPVVSGSYTVLQSKDVGSQAQVKVRIRLVNHGSSDFSIERMIRWDSSHADKGGTSACAVTLPAHATAETTQQFTIRRSDYQLWQRGFRPRLVLQMAGPGNTKSRAVVRLDRIAGQEAK